MTTRCHTVAGSLAPLARGFVAAGLVLLALPSHAQFVSFFDHVRGNGTHQYSLVFRADQSGSSGLFTNVTDGATTQVRLTAMTNGTGTAITTGGSAANPAPGTPAYATFNGFVDFGTTNNSAIQVPANSFLVYTFSNLNPNARYIFKGAAVRGGSASNYTNRWTKVTIVGADSATPNHTANAVTSTQAPTDLGPNDVAFNFGVNNLANQGDMAVWEDIDPGADGMFQIVSTRYTGAVPAPNSTTLNNPPYGYAINGIRLEEVITAPNPIVITNGPTPSSLTIEQSQTASFSIGVRGTAPRYQWSREDGQPISHAISTNGPLLTITNAQPGDSAVYRVRVTNSVSSVTSGPASLTVNPDFTPPSLLSGVALVSGSNFVLRFSEPLDTAAPLPSGAFHIELTAGGGALNVSSAFVTNGTNVFISSESARAVGQNYSITVDGNSVYDVNGNAFPGETIPVKTEVALLTFENTSWAYNHERADLDTDAGWRRDLGYDDSGWSNGISVFDGKKPQPPGRTSVSGLAVMTQLPLTNATFFSSNIPCYYFRGHFTLPVPPSEVSELHLRTFVDDFDVAYMNGSDIPVYHDTRNPLSDFSVYGYSGGNAVGTATILPADGFFSIDPANLVAGDNLICVKLFNDAAGSSDITFAYELIGVVNSFPAAGPSLSISSSGGMVAITWTDDSAVLYEASSVNATDSAWSPVAGASGRAYSFTVAPGAGQKFYTLRR